MRKVFPQLWKVDKEEGIANCIVILGNEYMPDSMRFFNGIHEYEERDEKLYIENVKSFFQEVCMDYDEIDENRKTKHFL